jgi:hypothetical protein
MLLAVACKVEQLSHSGTSGAISDTDTYAWIPLVENLDELSPETQHFPHQPTVSPARSDLKTSASFVVHRRQGKKETRKPEVLTSSLERKKQISKNTNKRVRRANRGEDYVCWECKKGLQKLRVLGTLP